MLMRKILCLWIALSAAAEAQDALQVRDYYRIESADEPSMSPDGALVAFTRHTINEAENVRRSEIWLASTDGSAARRRITVPAFDASRPRFSPDGKLLSFRSRRSGVTSTWFLRSDGLGEAFEIEGVSGEAEVSPDGRLVAFTKATLPMEPKPEPSGLEKELEKRFEGQIYDWMQVRFDRRGYLPDPKDPYASPPQRALRRRCRRRRGAEAAHITRRRRRRFLVERRQPEARLRGRRASTRCLHIRAGRFVGRRFGRTDRAAHR